MDIRNYLRVPQGETTVPLAGATIRELVAETRPPACECAYIGRRPLSAMRWVEGLSKNSFADKHNLELSHQHLLFPFSEQNIGFGPEGLFAEDVHARGYRVEGECLNGDSLRRAIAKTPEPSEYRLFGSNCQVYVERVIAAYRRLVGTR